MGCHLFQGITDATMTHNEAWHFVRLGRKLERADKTSRILDVKYFMLLPSAGRRRHAVRRHPLVGGPEVGQRIRKRAARFGSRQTFLFLASQLRSRLAIRAGLKWQ